MQYSLSSHFSDFDFEAGVDEVGRGCLAGSVVAAAVIFPKDYKNAFLNDSKKLSKKDREELDIEIRENAISFAIAEASPAEIDKINILNASFLAMQRAIIQLQPTPDFLIVDGNRFKTDLKIPYQCVIKGDSKYLSIAAASILAKNYRDNFMIELAEKYPHYGWETNVGYPTKKHKLGIAKYGLTEYHRKTFNSSVQLDLRFQK
ncbi:ribonuclease HII [Bernardetia sp.]|uniref:ribonuclease HII n=1 Tax=Bernardetia sp. TaxID=1937974 RepID=UPI0025BB5C3B|nr:ribonuclease HII [Bernardetia sp.]